MAGQRSADAGAVALHQVEHAGRHAGGMHDLSEDVAGERGHFRRLQHHGAAGGDGRGHLADDLVQRPVPGGDEAADADRFFDDHRRAAVFFELEVLQHGGGRTQVAHADRNLRALRQRRRRAHFLGDRGGQVAEALLVLGEDAVQDVQALFAGGLRPGHERLLGGLHGLVHVGGAAERDLARDFFSRWVDDVERLGFDRIDPLTVDVELQVLAHL